MKTSDELFEVADLGLSEAWAIAIDEARTAEAAGNVERAKAYREMSDRLGAIKRQLGSELYEVVPL